MKMQKQGSITDSYMGSFPCMEKSKCLMLLKSLAGEAFAIWLDMFHKCIFEQR